MTIARTIVLVAALIAVGGVRADDGVAAGQPKAADAAVGRRAIHFRPAGA